MGMDGSLSMRERVRVRGIYNGCSTFRSPSVHHLSEVILHVNVLRRLSAASLAIQAPG
jgi:hypothetical protein